MYLFHGKTDRMDESLHEQIDNVSLVENDNLEIEVVVESNVVV